MLIKGELRIEDLVALQKDSLKNSKIIRKQVNIKLVISTIILFVFLSMIQPSIHPAFTSLKIILVLIYVLLFPFFLEKGIIFRFKKGNHKKKLGPFSISINEIGIYIERKDSTRHIVWGEIQQVISESKYFFFYCDDNSGVIIPKSVVSSEGDFVRLLSSYLDKTKLEDKIESKKEQIKRIVLLLSVILIMLIVFLFYYFKL